MKLITALVALVIVAALGFVAYNWIASTPRIGPVGSTHIHQDFKVYLDGNAIDFSQQKYQVRAPYVHVEDNDGDVIHVHATGVTMGMFLESVGMKLTQNCFSTDQGTNYCNGNNKTLKFYVNNVSTTESSSYLLRDLDKILISYGGNRDETAIQQQLASITDKSKDALDPP